MSQKRTVRRTVQFETKRKGQKAIKVGAMARGAMPAGRLPRATKLLALAHRFEKLIQDGEVRDYAELARLGHVTRARVSQIMNLLNLAPELQEQLLLLASTQRGKERVTERCLRTITRALDWEAQRELWDAVHKYPLHQRTPNTQGYIAQATDG